MLESPPTGTKEKTTFMSRFLTKTKAILLSSVSAIMITIVAISLIDKTKDGYRFQRTIIKPIYISTGDSKTFSGYDTLIDTVIIDSLKMFEVLGKDDMIFFDSLYEANVDTFNYYFMNAYLKFQKDSISDNYIKNFTINGGKIIAESGRFDKELWDVDKKLIYDTLNIPQTNDTIIVTMKNTSSGVLWNVEPKIMNDTLYKGIDDTILCMTFRDSINPVYLKHFKFGPVKNSNNKTIETELIIDTLTGVYTVKIQEGCIFDPGYTDKSKPATAYTNLTDSLMNQPDTIGKIIDFTCNVADTIIDTLYDNMGNYNAYFSADAAVTATNPKLGTGCVAFDGSGDQIILGDVTELNSATEFTISLWLNSNDLAGSNRILKKEKDSDEKIQFGIYSNEIYMNINNGGTPEGSFNIAALVSTNEWYHLVITYDGGGAANADKLQAYVNGEAQSLSFSGTIPSSLANMSGYPLSFSNNAGTYNGEMDQIKVYTVHKGAEWVYKSYAANRELYTSVFDSTRTGHLLLDSSFNNIEVDTVICNVSTDTVKQPITNGLLMNIRSLLTADDTATVYVTAANNVGRAGAVPIVVYFDSTNMIDTVITFSSGINQDTMYNANAEATTGTMTLAGAAPDSIGIGDIVIKGSDRYFISSRTSSTVFEIRGTATNGGLPGDGDITFSSTGVKIIRAFHLLNSANDGADGAGFLATNDLSGQGYILQIACYADGADTVSVTNDDYITAKNYYLKFYTPYLSSEVGISQRHNGVWTTDAYRLEIPSGTFGVNFEDDYVKAEGLQIYHGATGYYLNATSEPTILWASYNIIKGSGTIDAAGYAIGIHFDTDTTYVYNNIVYDIQGGASEPDKKCGLYSNGADVAFIYNNTIRNTYTNYRTGGTPSSLLAKNNVSQDCHASGDCYSASNWDVASTNNNSDDGSEPGSNGNQAEVIFWDEANDTLWLDPTDTAAIDSGADLSADAKLAFSDDIRSRTRVPTWDMGAWEYCPDNYDTTYTDTTIHTTTCLALNDLQSFYGDTMRIRWNGCGDTVVDSIVIFRDSLYTDTVFATLDTVVVNCDSIQLTISACPSGDTTDLDTFYTYISTYDTIYRDTVFQDSTCIGICDSLHHVIRDSMQIDSNGCGVTITISVTFRTIRADTVQDVGKLFCPPSLDTSYRDTTYTDTTCIGYSDSLKHTLHDTIQVDSICQLDTVYNYKVVFRTIGSDTVYDASGYCATSAMQGKDSFNKSIFRNNNHHGFSKPAFRKSHGEDSDIWGNE